MNFDELLKDKKIDKILKKGVPDFSSAESDINAARDNLLSGNFDWGLNIAYNSVLRAGRELMFSLGYRAIGKNKHKTVFEFLKEIKINQELVDFFDKIRVKRNKNIYETPEDLSGELIEEIIRKAKLFVQEIRTFVQEIRTGVKDE